MFKKIWAGAGIVIALGVFAGCQPSATPTPTPSPLVSPTPQPSSVGLTETEAKAIAEATCIKGGESLAPGYYNGSSKTWWFDANLNATRKGCNPACVVGEDTKTAEINWRCTGLNPSDDGTVKTCTPEQRKAEVCTTEYDPVCAIVQIQCIKAPCNPIEETFGNACEACRNTLVQSYVAGACAGDAEKNCSPTCPAYSPPVPGWCNDGEIVPPVQDECGCYGPPRCSRASAEIKKLLVAKYPKYAATLTVTIGKETDNHARGSVGFEKGAPGGNFLAAKVDGKWQIVFDGNGGIPCSLSEYGFPPEMLSDCAS
ncbi:MAG: hypothetical protein PHI63_00425 [Patescibacteria group bacterium]|nr:hypothetical protein [Patescibacteria group bacterium]